jgi:hypothetical protein
MAETAKVIKLKGNPKNPEAAEHIIIFPGGSISVCRTSENNYWAHIEVNQDEIIHDIPSKSKSGRVVGSRLDYNHPPGDIREIEDMKDLCHIAVQIQTANFNKGKEKTNE